MLAVFRHSCAGLLFLVISQTAVSQSISDCFLDRSKCAKVREKQSMFGEQAAQAAMTGGA